MLNENRRIGQDAATLGNENTVFALLISDLNQELSGIISAGDGTLIQAGLLVQLISNMEKEIRDLAMDAQGCLRAQLNQLKQDLQDLIAQLEDAVRDTRNNAIKFKRDIHRLKT